MFFGFFAACIGRASAFGRLLLRLRFALIRYIFGGGYGLSLRGGGSLGALAALGFGLLGGLLVRSLLRGGLAGGGRLLGFGCLGGFGFLLSRRGRGFLGILFVQNGFSRCRFGWRRILGSKGRRGNLPRQNGKA